MSGTKTVFFSWYREEPPVVLDEHQRDADDGRAVLDAHGVRTHVAPSFPLEQVRAEDHGQVSGCHLVTRNLRRKTRWEGKILLRKLNTFIKICI